ncbi:MAG: hypothetical protein QOG73_1235, partial [Acetobacteraceae bacterium]|nr:hypothetical protein [Acetobacteraceae bacterium]
AKATLSKVQRQAASRVIRMVV